MSGQLPVRDLRSLFERLTAQYEYLTDNRSKLETDCFKLREYIEAQVQQIQSLNTDFEKLHQDFLQRRNRLSPLNSDFRRHLPPPPPAQPDEPTDQEWEVESLVSPDKIDRPLEITLVAEILDVSVICSTAFSPDGNCLAIGSDRTLRIYNVETDDFSFQYNLEDKEERLTNHIRSIAWTVDGQKVLCGGEDGKVRVFSVPERSLIKTIGVAKGEVFPVTVATSLGYFATVADDGALTLFRVSDCEQIVKIPLDSDGAVVATSVAISTDGLYLAVGYGDCYVRIWEYRTRRLILEHKCHTMGVYAVKFLPRHSILVTGSLDSTVKLWNWKVGREPKFEIMKVFDVHSSYVLSLAVDPTGDLIISGSKDLTATVSSVSAGAVLYRIRGHSNSIITVAYNPKGNMFCTGSGDHSVKIWLLQNANGIDGNRGDG
jgi:WD40 repeat protein